MDREKLREEIEGILEDCPSQFHVRRLMDLIERVRQETWEEAYRSAEYERED